MKKNRCYRCFKTGLKILLILFLLIGMLCAWILYTESGTKQMVKVVSQFVPGELRIQNTAGTFMKGLSLIDCHYKHDIIEMTSQDIKLTLNSIIVTNAKIQFKGETVEIRLFELGLQQDKFYFGPGLFSFKQQEFALIPEKPFSSLFHLTVNQKKVLKGELELYLQNLTGLIHGKYDIRLLDLNLLYHYFPMISRLKANIQAHGNIEGSIHAPKITLQATAHPAIFSIPKQKITVRNFQLTLSGTLTKPLKLESVGQLGGNLFYISGWVNPYSKTEFVDLHCEGEAIRIYNTKEIHIRISPRVRIHCSNSKLSMAGSVKVVEADIKLQNNPQALQYSNDVVFVGKGATEGLSPTAPLFKIVPNIHFIIEDNVRFKGYGLEAQLRGDLHLSQREDGQYIGNGRLTIKRGKYRLPSGLGSISRGHLLYTPGTLLADPLLDIRIVQQPMAKFRESAAVGVYVQGTLQNPQYHLFSTGHLQQKEILSHLGMDAREREGENHPWLSQTALLVGGGANPIVSYLQSKLKLEELGVLSRDAYKYIATQEGNDMALVVGKSLGKRFYLQFLQGMVVPYSTLRLQYFLNPNFALGVESSTTGLGGDVSFSVEKK